MAGSEPTTKILSTAWRTLSACRVHTHANARLLLISAVFSLHAQDHVGKPIPTYVTGDECLFCHRVKVADTWQQNPHARTIFPNEKGDLFLGAKQARPVRQSGYGKLELPNSDKEKFANHCAGCHSTAVDPKTKTFATTSLDCYTCHGIADPDHTKNIALMRFSSKYPKTPAEIASVCGSCHLRGGKSRSSGLPYPNNFVPGDDLFHDFEVDLSQADNASLNPADRHIYRNVRDVLKNGATLTCLSCHVIHADTSAKHKRVLTSAICEDCHNPADPKSAVKKYEVHSSVCEY
ncbi:MAG TPA: hypothetical protein VEU96_33340 [Bryobacteraceae bacterium]|nr:hypothetical protein [Bryobacteraceae bacterium]